MTRHVASYTDPITHEEIACPEVWVIPAEGTPSRFRLDGSAKVIVRFPPIPHKDLKMIAEQLHGGWWKGLWGGIQNAIRRSPDESRHDFEVEVEGQIWECEPLSIVKHIEELRDRITKRNRMIEDLRKGEIRQS